MAAAAFLAGVTGGARAQECAAPWECPAGWFCDAPPGQCQGPGDCSQVPDLCPQHVDPVCGCDGHTHQNSCQAAAAGVRIRHPGECGAPPPAPSFLQASRGSHPDRIALVWEEVAGEEGYRVFRAAGEGGPWEERGATAAGTAAWDDSVPCRGAGFWYRVTAFNADGESPFSPSARGHVANDPPAADAGGPYFLERGGALTLSGAGSADPNQGCGDRIVTWQWNLDGGGDHEGLGETLTLAWPQVESLICGGECLQDAPYPVGLRVRDGNNATGDDATAVTVVDNRPRACFSFSPDPAACGGEVAFDAACSGHGHPQRRPVAFAWDFDHDGVAFVPDAAGIAAARAFGSFGSHPVALRVTDDNDPPRSDVVVREVPVSGGNRPPEARAGGPYLAVAGRETVLDGSGSADPDVPCGDRLVSFRWDLDGDGLFDDADGAVVTLAWEDLAALLPDHLPEDDPSLTVALQVTDSFGLVARDSAAVTLDFRLFADDFADGGPAGDPQWQTPAGEWRVTPRGSFLSPADAPGLALVRADQLPAPFAAGSAEVRLRFTGRHRKTANASLVFHWRGRRDHRWLRLEAGPPGKGLLTLGQEGDPAGTGETGGVILSRGVRFPAGGWQRLRLVLGDDGRMEAWLNEGERAALRVEGRAPATGRFGLAAARSATLFDDVVLRDRRAPSSPR